MNFLRVNENKQQLFLYLADQLMDVDSDGKKIFTRGGTKILSNQHEDNTWMMISPCTHEEADTRLMLHIYHCVQQGYKSVCLKTVDTDVVVLAIYVYKKINSIYENCLEEIWIEFGTCNGKNFYSSS